MSDRGKGFNPNPPTPVGTETGLGKFFANRGTLVDSSTIIDQGVTADALPVKSSIPQVTADDFLTEASKVTTKNKPSTYLSNKVGLYL